MRFVRRFQQSVGEMLASSNRDAGSGGGAGKFPLVSLGSYEASSLGTYNTANSSTWTTITGTTITISVARPTLYWYLVAATGGCNNINNNKGYVRGNIVGQATTPNMVLTFAGGALSGSFYNSFTWFYPTQGAIQPGTYTITLEAATDNNTTNLAISQVKHQFFDLGG